MSSKPNYLDGANGQADENLATALATPAAKASPVVHEVRSFLADIEDLVTSTTSLTGEDLARAKAKLAERVAAAKASVTRMSGAIADRARDTVRTTDAYVHDRPWQAMGIAAAVGVLIGVVLTRRRA